MVRFTHEGYLSWTMADIKPTVNQVPVTSSRDRIHQGNAVRSMARDHQVPDCKLAMGHAYGGGSQYFAMWLVGATDPPETDRGWARARIIPRA